MSDTILKITGLSKTFRSHWTFRPIKAVRNISLEVARGEAFGFLGHNGAGKTTAIKCIVGLIHKTTGEIYLNGEPLRSAEQHKIIGYLPELPYFYDHLQVEETLDFLASLHGYKRRERIERVGRVLEKVGLSQRRDTRVRELSKGLQQRLGFAQAILNDPELLILDEPFSGLDPVGRIELRNLILELKHRGTTVFLSSHILSDIENICDRVCILSQGEVEAKFHMNEGPALYGEKLELTLSGIEAEQLLQKKLSSLADSSDTHSAAGVLYGVYLFSDYAVAKEALGASMLTNAKIVSFRASGGSLEEIFIKVTGLKNTSPKKLALDEKNSKKDLH